jgi:hypothetical protein
MSSSDRKDGIGEDASVGPTTRRQFLGKAAAVAVAAPALLAACSDQSPVAPRTVAAANRIGSSGELMSVKGGGTYPWMTVHKQLVSTIGAASNVKVPALEEANGIYLQRVITSDDRTGTGLATILRRSYKWDTGALEVSVEDTRGRRWPARNVGTQEDLVYAVKDALATNTLADGVLRDSLEPGKPVVAVITAAVVQFFNSAASDYYGNHLQVASSAFSDMFAGDFGELKFVTTTRDFLHC